MSLPDGAPPTGAPAFPAPVNRDDLGQGPMIMAITWIFQIAALSAVTARLVVRRQKGVIWGWDDYLMLMAVTIQLALQSLATSSFAHGMGKHDLSLYPEELMAILRHNWVSVPPGILVGLLSRTSIAVLLIRLFAPYMWFKYYLISFTILMWVGGIVQMPLTFVQVKPVEALWNFTIIPESRWDIRIWLYTAYFNQLCCTFSNFTYALFPVIFIWKLNMAVRRKISLILVMCGSIFSMIMSILKTVSLGQVANSAVGTPDVQYSSSPQLIYGFSEQSVVIIMGCIPTLHAIKRSDFAKLSFLKRYYGYMRKSTTSAYASNRYADLDTESHKLSNIHTAKATTETSVGADNSLTTCRHHGGSNDELLIQGQITRTDRYAVTYEPQERKQRENV